MVRPVAGLPDPSGPHQFLSPAGVRVAAVTPPGIGADQDSLGPLLPVASGQFPPPPDAFHRELRRVMRHADVDHRPVLSDLVCPRPYSKSMPNKVDGSTPNNSESDTAFSCLVW